ncbi:MAG TPA: hypothetical protein DEA08_07580 [Planctomycetes bacterium]|nr:hypothetical protein [Planctomycetota bacterium]
MTSERDEVERFLQAARRRLARQGALERASAPLLAALIAAELALAFPSAQPLLAGGALLCSLAALARAASAPRPSALWAASLLDARCESGATLASAAEALEGQHPRFAEWLLGEARALLAERRPSELLPWRPPAALVLGGAAAALLPLVLLQPSEASPTRERGGARSLLDPVLIAGGGGGEGGEAAEPDPEGRLALLPATPERPALPDADPFAALPLDVAEELRAELGKLARSLEGGGASAGARGADQDPQDPAAPESELEQALRRGDAEAARRALQELSAEAASGDAAARAKARELSQRARAGAGVAEGDEGAPPPPASQGEAGGPTRAGARGLPPELRAAVQRYFEL